MDPLNTDIVIIGGGPAGVATSLTLTARGVPHVVVEAQKQPQRKAGEALPPNAKPLLRQLGMDDLMEHPAHLPYHGNQSIWKGSPLRTEDFIKCVHGHGYLLDRLVFEQQLRKLVKAPFYTGYKLRSLSSLENGVEVTVENLADSLGFKARYIVDATGRKASVCRHLGVVPTVLDEWFGLWFYAEGKAPKQIFVESTEQGWWYAAPFGANQVTMMFFTRKEYIPTKAKIPAFLQKQFRQTTQLAKTFSIPDLSPAEVQIRPSGTAFLDQPYGTNWLAVGDAAYAYDPISSFGITSALAGGYYAGHALADSLEGKDDALGVYRYVMENAFQGYKEKLIKVYA